MYNQHIVRCCCVCGVRINQGRLQALPNCRTCIKHSDAKPLTTADVEIDGPSEEDVRQCSVGNGNDTMNGNY